jgi:uncharacterized protein (TIGR00661 family)
MKILYAVQATGNGHISRAMELLPYLNQYAETDIFLSGSNSSLNLNFPIKYRSKGLSLFYKCQGKLDYTKTVFALSPWRLRKEVKDLPVDKYDLVLNDFECITAMACAMKKIPSVNFGHQASFYSVHTPRPKEKNKIGEWILKNYARASFYIGLHFQQYDDFILPPVIKKEISKAQPADKDFFAVYLPSYCENAMEKYFHPLAPHRFRIFSWQTKKIKRSGNIIFLPVDKTLFNEALINCSGMITGAGFETPAEALELEKKLMVMPIRGQYEQQCNAAALEQMGIKKIEKLDDDFTDHFNEWSQSAPVKIKYDHSTEDIVAKVMKLSIAHIKEIGDYQHPIDPFLSPLH